MDEKSTSGNTLDAINNRLEGVVLVDPGDVPGNGPVSQPRSDSGGGSDSGPVPGNGTVEFNKDGSIRKKRGRKPGQTYSNGTASGAAPRAKGTKTPTGVSDVLFSLHLMAAKLFGEPLLELDKEESGKLAGAIMAVQEHYQWETSAETLLWIHVFGVCGSIYGPRVGAFIMRKKIEAESKPKPTPAPQPNKAPIVDTNTENGVIYDVPPAE